LNRPHPGLPQRPRRRPSPRPSSSRSAMAYQQAAWMPGIAMPKTTRPRIDSGQDPGGEAEARSAQRSSTRGSGAAGRRAGRGALRRACQCGRASCATPVGANGRRRGNAARSNAVTLVSSHRAATLEHEPTRSPADALAPRTMPSYRPADGVAADPQVHDPPQDGRGRPHVLDLPRRRQQPAEQRGDRRPRISSRAPARCAWPRGQGAPRLPDPGWLTARGADPLL
jgi:hypothetical protein